MAKSKFEITTTGMPNKEQQPKITDDMVSWETARAGGPGGQKVNKSESAARLRVSIDNLPFTDQQKEAIKQHLPPRFLTKEGELIVKNAEGRSQAQNKARALEVANLEIQKALEISAQERKRQEHKEKVKRHKGGGGGKQKPGKPGPPRGESTDDLLAEALEEDPELGKELDN